MSWFRFLPVLFSLSSLFFSILNDDEFCPYSRVWLTSMTSDLALTSVCLTFHRRIPSFLPLDYSPLSFPFLPFFLLFFLFS
jgi:hypothetical protein